MLLLPSSSLSVSQVHAPPLVSHFEDLSTLKWHSALGRRLKNLLQQVLKKQAARYRQANCEGKAMPMFCAAPTCHGLASVTL